LVTLLAIEAHDPLPEGRAARLLHVQLLDDVMCRHIGCNEGMRRDKKQAGLGGSVCWKNVAAKGQSIHNTAVMSCLRWHKLVAFVGSPPGPRASPAFPACTDPSYST
jgi:hypothetical protein